jgi:phage shock protein A
MAHVKLTANVKKWALVAKSHLDADRTELARKALKKAEFWERKLKKLERPEPRTAARTP